MRRTALFGGVILLSGCVYLNTLYNARDAWDRGERARLAGDEATAHAAWEEAAERAGRAWRKEPEGAWADESMLTVGRALVRLGRWDDARTALQETIATADDPRIVAEARVFLGAAQALAGLDAAALETLNAALDTPLPDRVRAEGHMWRARLALRRGDTDLGWWDLDRATEFDRRLAVPAHLERLRWGIARADGTRALSGATALLDEEAAAVWADSVRTLVSAAARNDEWGPAAAARLLVPARSGPWASERRNALLFLRADLLLAAGDSTVAETELGTIAAGVGDDAVEARLRIAAIRMHRATTPTALGSVRTVLLPAVGDPRVTGYLEDLRVLELLAARGIQGDPLAWFAAAEFARDRLKAPGLARGLFMATSESDPQGRWAAKALLAALAMTTDPDSRAALGQLLDRHQADPYLRAARNGYLDRDRLRESEAELQARTGALLASVREEASRMDAEIRSRSGGGS